MLAMLVEAGASAGLLLLARLLLAWLPLAAAAAACAKTGLMQTRVIRMVMGCSRKTAQTVRQLLQDAAQIGSRYTRFN
jgi:hypothetical protein